MLELTEELEQLERGKTPIRVGIIGTGQMGRALAGQLACLPGLRPVVTADHRPSRAREALLTAGVPEEEIREADSSEQAEELIRQGKLVITGDSFLAARTPSVDVVVDATGNIEDGLAYALEAISRGKHLVTMNAEADVTVGPLLAQKAREAGVVYTGMAGDEPGAVMELYRFARAMGLTVLVLGKGKNNPVNREATPDSAAAEALAKGMNPRMLASFQDGTKTMVELTAIANATGFLPDIPGARGPSAEARELPGIYRLREEGGILDHYSTVDYVSGVAPGVFAIVTTPNPELRAQLKYLSMGDGPNYLLYRPYHLCSMETPISIARAALHKLPTIVPREGAPFAETAAVAKRDLQAGEYLDGIGGRTVYGTILPYRDAAAQGALPMGLVNGHIKMKQNAAKGQLITYDMVELWEDSLALRLRKEQDGLLGKGLL